MDYIFLYYKNVYYKDASSLNQYYEQWMWSNTDQYKCSCWTKVLFSVCLMVHSPSLSVKRWHPYSVCNSISYNQADILSWFPSWNEPWQVEYGTRFQQRCREADNEPAGRENVWRGPTVGDIYHKSQMNHPADFNVPPPPSLSLSLTFFTRFFQLGGFGAVTQTTCCVQQESRQSTRLSFIDDRCQDVFLLFLFWRWQIESVMYTRQQWIMYH